MATCIDVAGASYPNTYKGNTIIPLEGQSLVSSFNGNSMEERPLFWEHEGNKAIRLGEYKLVSKWAKDSEYNWELYDLKGDRSEMNDLSDTMPDKVIELEMLWKQWAQKAGVCTWGSREEIVQSNP
ncbi:MAG: sulfatase/phosphatase domain-containing protein, partial [Bacteroidota bacterium]